MSPDESKRLATLATRFIAESRAQWADVVCIGAALSTKQFDIGAKRLAEQSGVSAATIKRRWKAVKYGIEQGLAIDKLIEQGQQVTVSAYVRGKVKARSAPLVAFPHRITPEVRAGLEELYQRIGRVVKCKTFDEATEFILAVFADWPDEELEHQAGMSHAEEKKSQARG